MTFTQIVTAAMVALVVTWIWSRSRPRPGPSTENERSELEHQIAVHLAQGRKIDAIKAYRRLHGVDLKSAKEAIEREPV